MRSSIFGHRFLSVLAASALAVAGLLVLAPAASATPDPIAVTMSASSDPVAPGSPLTYTIVSSNNEPQVANVRLTDQLTGLKNVVLTSSRGYCTRATCSSPVMRARCRVRTRRGR